MAKNSQRVYSIQKTKCQQKLKNVYKNQKRMFEPTKLKFLPTPRPKALCPTNIRRRSIGKLQSALRKSQLPYALLQISFVSESVAEIVTSSQLAERLAATLKLMGIAPLPFYNICEGNIQNTHLTQTYSSLEAAKRFIIGMETCI